MNCDPASPESAHGDDRVRHSGVVIVDGLAINRHHYRELSSTMDAARQFARCGANWTCITADLQTSGRGTQGRAWFAPPGTSLMVSLVLPPPITAGGLETLSVETAGILRDVLRGHADLAYTIKHPNDLLIGGRKCAGILYESVTCRGAMTTLVLGMGVNLAQTSGDFERAGLTDATSIGIAAGTAPDPDALLGDFLTRFVPFYRGRAIKTAVRGDIPVQP